MSMNSLTNKDMSEFWNGGGGLNWMRFQSRLEKSLKLFGQQAISAAKIKDKEKILDVGCGWGDTSFDLAQCIGSNGHVRGLDISDFILEQARSRRDWLGVDNIEFECLDVESCNFEPEVYDVVFSRFGVMFFNDPVAAFKNIKAALKPNGRLVFVCWQSVKANQWVNLPYEISTNHVPVTQEPNPEAPGGFSFGNADRVKQILNDAEFNNIIVKPYKTKFNVGDTLEEALTLLSNLGPASSIITAPDIDDEIKQLIVDDLCKALITHKTSQGIELDAATWIVTATNN